MVPKFLLSLEEEGLWELELLEEELLEELEERLFELLFEELLLLNSLEDRLETLETLF